MQRIGSQQLCSLPLLLLGGGWAVDIEPRQRQDCLIVWVSVSTCRCFSNPSPTRSSKFLLRAVSKHHPVLFNTCRLFCSFSPINMHRAITSASRASAVSPSSLKRLGSGRNLQQLRFAHKVSFTVLKLSHAQAIPSQTIPC